MKVTPITAARGAPRAKPETAALSSVAVPFEVRPGEQLDHMLRVAYLDADARALWLTRPNLRAAAEATLRILSLHWPVQTGAGLASAAQEAVIAAVKRVRHGLDQHETTTPLVVRNFLEGLASVAEPVARTQAWGYSGGRSVAQYDQNGWNFAQWANSGGFEEIRFVIGPEPLRADLKGTRLKFLCSVADFRDVGMAELHK